MHFGVLQAMHINVHIGIVLYASNQSGPSSTYASVWILAAISQLPFPKLFQIWSEDVRLTLSSRTLLSGQPVLDTLGHPFQSPVRLHLCGTSSPALKLSFAGSDNLFLLLLVDDPIVVEVSLLLRYLGFAFDVVAAREKRG